MENLKLFTYTTVRLTETKCHFFQSSAMSVKCPNPLTVIQSTLAAKAFTENQ